MKVLCTLSTLTLSMFANSWALNMKAKQTQYDEVVASLDAITTAIEANTAAVSDIAATVSDIAATNKELTSAVSDIPYDTAYIQASGVCVDN